MKKQVVAMLMAFTMLAGAVTGCGAAGEAQTNNVQTNETAEADVQTEDNEYADTTPV